MWHFLACAGLVTATPAGYWATRLSQFPVIDFGEAHLPQAQRGGRVVEFLDSDHLDDALRDTPDAMRPPALLLFYGHRTCPEEAAELEFNRKVEKLLPSRERLLAGKYDLDAGEGRAWHGLSPERDPALRFGVSACPSIVFLPRSCDGQTEWCVKTNRNAPASVQYLGCEDFVDRCQPATWDGTGDWVDWAKALLAAEGALPQTSPVLGSHKQQAAWLQARDVSAFDIAAETHFQAQGVPAFSDLGYKLLDTPPELAEWGLSYYIDHVKARRHVAEWTQSNTRENFHAVPSYVVPVDRVNEKLTGFIDAQLKPIAEQWSGLNLTLSVIDGITERRPGSTIKRHVHPPQSHAISFAICLGQLESHSSTDDADDAPAWPLEGVGYDGRHVRIHQTAGTMVMYEGAKFIQGRPSPLLSGVHVELRVHYKVTFGANHFNWDKVSREAKRLVERNTHTVRYGSKRTGKSPPVLTQEQFGELATPDVRWQLKRLKLELERESDGDKQQDRLTFKVRFLNESPRKAFLFFNAIDDVKPVLTCEVQSGDSCQRNVGNDHAFFWSFSPKGLIDARQPTETFTATEIGKKEVVFYGTVRAFVFNDHSTPLDVVKMDKKRGTAEVLCSLAPATTCTLNVVYGQRFVWRKEGSSRAMGKFQINLERLAYAFSDTAVGKDEL